MRRLLLPLLCLSAAAVPGLAGSQAAPARVLVEGSGDILFHTRVVAAGRDRGFFHLFEPLAGLVSADGVAFANLETPLSEAHTPMRGDPPRLGAPPEAATALRRAGLDVLSVANNHVWDQRAEGLVETVDAIRAQGMAAVGAAPTAEEAPGPVVVERSGTRVAFVAFTTILQGHPGTRRPPLRVSLYDDFRVRRALQAAREQADVVVASVHWGLAYHPANRRQQRQRAAFLVRVGADVVLGHGPHVLQPVERVPSPRGEALVAYSLGNLISNQGYHFRRGHRDRRVERPLRDPATRDGVWLRVPVEVRGGRVSVGAVTGVPLWTANNYWREHRREDPGPSIRVLPLADVADVELREERRRAIAEALGDAVRLEPR